MLVKGGPWNIEKNTMAIDSFVLRQQVIGSKNIEQVR